MYFIQHCFICRPSASTVSEDSGIEPDFDIGSQTLIDLNNFTSQKQSFV